MGELEPKQAYEFLQNHPDALLIDCRSEMEYLFVGHPLGALHVSWNDGPDWEVNPHFVGQVKKLAGTDHARRHGFVNVYHVVHGFEGELDARHRRNSLAGWRYDGLPCEQC